MHQEHPVGYQQRLLLVVGDEQRGQAQGALDLADLVAQVAADARVQRRERLVHQQDARLDHQRPGQGHALALAAGELLGVLVGLVGELHQAQHLRDPAPALAGLDPLHAQAEGDVARHRQVGEERVVLEDHADAATLGRQMGDVVAADADAAPVQGREAGDGA